MDDVSMGDDTLEATTLVMGGSDVAIMADVEDIDMEESTVGTITKMSNSNDIVIYMYQYIICLIFLSGDLLRWFFKCLGF